VQTLTLDPGYTTGTLTINTGTLTVASSGSLAKATINGGGNLTIGGTGNPADPTPATFTWSGGTMSGNGTTVIDTNSTMNVTNDNANQVYLIQRTLTNRAAVNWTGSKIVMRDGATFTNNAMNGFTAAGDGVQKIVQDDQGLPATFTVAAGASASINCSVLIDTVKFVNSGSVSILSSVDVNFNLQLSCNSTSTGTYTVGPGSKLILKQGNQAVHLFDGATVTGTGTVDLFPSAHLTVKNQVHVVNINDTGGATNQSLLDGDGTLFVSGIYTWQGGNWDGSGKTQIDASGTLDISSFQTNPISVVGQTLENNGTVKWASNQDLIFSNGAAINNYAGALFKINVSMGPRTLSDGGSAGIFTNKGAMTKDGDAAAVISIKFKPAGGTVEDIQYKLEFTKKVTMLDGTILADPDTQIVFDAGFEQDGGSTTAQSGATLTVTGELDEFGGTITLNSAELDATDFYQTGGTTSANPGSIINVSDTLTESGGTITLNQAELDTVHYTQTGGDTLTLGAGALIAVNDEASVAGATLSIGSGGTMSVGVSFVQTDGSTTVHQDAYLTDGGLFQQEGGTVSLGDTTNGATLTATGGVQVSAGAILSGWGSIVADVSNAGEVDKQGGTLAITGTYTQLSGATTNMYGGTFHVSSYLVEQGGTFTLTGTVQADYGMLIQSGAILYGNGTIIGSLTNAGIINLAGGSGPSSMPGTLSIDGDFTQTSTGELQVHLYGDNSCDELQVSGHASLDGALDVYNSNGYLPSAGHVFVAVTCDSHSGTFAGISLPPVSFGHWALPYWDDSSSPDELILWVVYPWQ
jgi:fibronectin-binding autotransporter adhesin